MEKLATVPLADSEIREGLERLMRSALMTCPDARPKDAQGFSGASDMTSWFASGIGASLVDFADEHGLAPDVRRVIEDLALALVRSKLSVEDLFRFGTSPEAMRLFEQECEEWHVCIARCRADEVSS
jgi:hypothetical protein